MCCELLDRDISMIIQVLKRPGAIVAAYSINLPVETPMGDLEENIYQVSLICFSVVFDLTTIAFNGFRWLWTIGQTMRWFRWIVVV